MGLDKAIKVPRRGRPDNDSYEGTFVELIEESNHCWTKKARQRGGQGKVVKRAVVGVPREDGSRVTDGDSDEVLPQKAAMVEVTDRTQRKKKTTMKSIDLDL